MTADVVLVGGGLANSLIAWRLTATRPEVDLVVLERGDRLGGNHTWSFHTEDVAADVRRWLAPLVTASWPHYDVRFPDLERRLSGGYHTLTSERLHEVVAGALGDRVRFGVEVDEVGCREVRLRGGERVRAGAVIDGRGWAPCRSLDVAFQKFLGRVVRLDREHRLDGPILMDATVEQRDGFRFVYTLPLTPDSLLIEDTRYSDSSALDLEKLRDEIARYADARGWRVRRVEREETGVLPIVLSGDIDALWDEIPERAPRSGMRAGLFHPTTGYSLPEAARLADDLRTVVPVDGEALLGRIRRRSRDKWKRDGYFRMLNRMMFRAADPGRRYRVLERFYRLPEPLIRRFYAGRPTRRDRVRILLGRPPVALSRAWRCLAEPRAGRPSEAGGGRG